jgi:hypothetical protein
MSTPYTASYALRYGIPSVQQQIEVAVMTAAGNIANEDPATADHANRIAWAHWANGNSSVAWQPFAWPVAMNPSIQANVQTDSSGQSIKDADIQFVVNSNVEAVITYWVANPPPGVKTV